MVAADPSAARWSSGLAVVASQIDLETAVQEAFARVPLALPRIAAPLAFAERRYTDAIDHLNRSGLITLSARIRMLAAATSLDEGRSGRAEDLLEQALAF